MLTALLLAAQLSGAATAPAAAPESAAASDQQEIAYVDDSGHIPLWRSGVVQRPVRDGSKTAVVSLAFTRTAEDRITRLVISTRTWRVSVTPYIRRIDVAFPERSFVSLQRDQKHGPPHFVVVVPTWTKTSDWECDELVLDILNGKVVDVDRGAIHPNRCGR